MTEQEKSEKIKIVPLKVVLLSYPHNPEQVVAVAIRQCYSAAGVTDLLARISEERRAALIRQVISSGHTSTIEHAFFTFAIEGISRACSHELVRHRIASYSQQSQRYVDLSDGPLPVVIPPDVMRDEAQQQSFIKELEAVTGVYKDMILAGFKPENARYILPNATETKIVVSMNARSLYNFFEQRLCERAQWEIRKLAARMRAEVMKVAPNIFRYSGPTCVTEKICWEGKLACDRVKGIGIELRERYEAIQGEDTGEVDFS